jgi:hypothetical protein
MAAARRLCSGCGFVDADLDPAHRFDGCLCLGLKRNKRKPGANNAKGAAADVQANVLSPLHAAGFHHSIPHGSCVRTQTEVTGYSERDCSQRN